MPLLMVKEATTDVGVPGRRGRGIFKSVQFMKNEYFHFKSVVFQDEKCKLSDANTALGAANSSCCYSQSFRLPNPYFIIKFLAGRKGTLSSSRQKGLVRK